MTKKYFLTNIILVLAGSKPMTNICAHPTIIIDYTMVLTLSFIERRSLSHNKTKVYSVQLGKTLRLTKVIHYID